MPRSRNGGSTVSGPSSSALRLADQDRRQPHRADQKRADARGERKLRDVRDLLADAIGGLGEPPRPEGPRVEMLDRRRVVRRFRQDGEGKVAHVVRGAITTGAGRVHHCRFAAVHRLHEPRTASGDVDGTSGRRRLARRQLRQGTDGGRPLQPADHQIPQLGHARRQPRPVRRRRLPRRDRPLSPLRVARLPVGAPHHHLPPSEAAGERHLDVGRPPGTWARTAGPSTGGRLERRCGERDAEAFGNLSAGRSQIHRPRHRAGAVGQAAQDHRQQRIVRDHPDAEFGVRRPDQREHRLLSAGAARRDRRRQRPRLSERQQRRLSRRLRHRAGRLRGSVPQRVRARSTTSSGGCRGSATSPARA